MRKKSIIIALLVLVAFSVTAFAQEEEGRDIVELYFSGGMGIPGGGLTDWTTGGYDRAAKTGYDLSLGAGFFLKPTLILGFDFTYTQFGIENNGEQANHHHRLFTPNLYLKYSFEGESNWAPYLKGQVGVDNPKFSTFVTNEAGNRFRELSYGPALMFGVTAGIFYYSSYYSGLYLEAGYRHSFTKEVTGTYQDTEYTFGENINYLGINLGIRVLFGTGE